MFMFFARAFLELTESMALLGLIRGRVARHRTAAAGMVAMCIKGLGALLALAVFTLAARAMTADDFGRLAIWFNAMSFLAVVAVFGQDTLIARSWGEYVGRHEPERAVSAYRFGWIATIASALAFVGGVLALAPVVAGSVAASTVYAAALFLFAQTMLHYSSHSCRVVVGFVVSETGRDIIWRLALLAVVVWAMLRGGVTPAQFFLAGAIGMSFSLVYQSREVWRTLSSSPAKSVERSDRREWLRRGFSMWLSAIVEAAAQYADVMLIGYFASPAVAGDFFVAARIANIFIMVMAGLNTYSYSHSASLFFSGQLVKLQEILRSLVVVATVMLAPCLLIIYFFGAEILTIFGERYAGDYPTLLVLATACFIMSLAGQASIILLTTGNERVYSRIITVATLIRLSLTALLAWRFGALGAACGWALVNAPLALALSAICRRNCGVDTSILSVLRNDRNLSPAEVQTVASFGDPLAASKHQRLQ